ncbi:propanediol utilization protein [Photobacterium proteolyticum]|uniref:Propanediol utilization protein n=2 Tax=Photobacterium TaxID=657 RepID=A0A1Q9GJ28_9GAMM|nr:MULTISPECIES: BMC domain-containing protein [Photobacterium]NBI56068.1 BMC domain-containing protein [Photobacterium alginatilyticum]OLQ74461.1 propanediol utilization protein [Photobacterium proteolyticum]
MDTLGVVETKTIASGVRLADEMLKIADVTLVRASTICSGRYLIFVSGKQSDVATAVSHARLTNKLTGNFVISGISPELVAVLKKRLSVKTVQAIGLIESSTVSSGVAAADIAVKSADVSLIRFVAGLGICGKSYFIFSGELAAVEEANKMAKEFLGTKYIESTVIARPEHDVVKAIIGVR